MPEFAVNPLAEVYHGLVFFTSNRKNFGYASMFHFYYSVVQIVTLLVAVLVAMRV